MKGKVFRLTVFAAAVLGLAYASQRQMPRSAAVVPELPAVENADLRQKLHTIRAVVIEHGKLAFSCEPTDEKSSRRLEALRQGFEDLRRHCIEGLDSAEAQAPVVQEFLESCASAICADRA